MHACRESASPRRAGSSLALGGTGNDFNLSEPPLAY
jgi:hypothetical protein